MLDIIIFAAIAIFVFVRLFKALGDNEYKRERNEEIEKIYEEIRDINSTKVEEILLEDVKLPAEVRDALSEIRKSDPTFSSQKFLSGAKKAFEIILEAFSKGEKEALKQLLDADTYEDFEHEIDRRKTSGQLFQTTIVGINQADLVAATIEGTTINIKVKIVSEQINMIKDAKDMALLSGSATKINLVDDVWTFARDLNASDKIWKLVSTDASA